MIFIVFPLCSLKLCSLLFKGVWSTRNAHFDVGHAVPYVQAQSRLVPSPPRGVVGLYKVSTIK